MFRFHKEMSRLDLPAARVLRLERSLSDVQVAMPGFPAQEATAYLCGFAAGQGFRVAVILHLHSSARLAVYLNDEGEVAKRDSTRVYNQALGFAESMGFMLGDLDIHLKSGAEREALWKSLPLQAGVVVPAREPVAQAEPAKAEPAKAEPAKAEPAKNEPAKNEPAKAEPAKAEPAKNEPAKAEPVKTEPVKAEPVKAEPVKAEPVKAEPVKAEPVKAEPVKAEPVKAEPVKAEPGKSGSPASVPVAPVVPPATSAELPGKAQDVLAQPLPASSGPVMAGGARNVPRVLDAAELARRRKQLRENLGRFLASL